jgi:hypothetical protein
MVSSADGAAIVELHNLHGSARARRPGAPENPTIRTDCTVPIHRSSLVRVFRLLPTLAFIFLAIVAAAPASGASQQATCQGRAVTIFNDTPGASVSGTGGADVILATGDGQTVNAAGGNDVVCTEFSNGTVLGGAGDDTILAVGGLIVDGQSGHDTMKTYGTAEVRGGSGDDRMEGAYVQRALGGAGNDVLHFIPSGLCDGGSGQDVVIPVVDTQGCFAIVNVP